MNAQEKLKLKLKDNLHVCVGLDADIKKIPPHLHATENPIFEFNKRIIDVTYKNVCAYKLNFAFYEKEGAWGLEQLLKTKEYIPHEIMTIADAKRGDIGNTSIMYASAIFDEMQFDSVTLNPYMGFDSIVPFQQYKDKLSFILALTSNKSALDFEKLRLNNGKLLFQQIIEKVNSWNANKNLGIVFGATNEKELEQNISLFDDLFILLPGIGAQGGNLNSILKIFKQNNNSNYFINISRSIIYSDNTKQFQTAVKKKLQSYNEVIFSFLS